MKKTIGLIGTVILGMALGSAFNHAFSTSITIILAIVGASLSFYCIGRRR